MDTESLLRSLNDANVKYVIIGATAFLITTALLLKTTLSNTLGIFDNYPIIFLTATGIFIIVSVISLFLLRKIQAKGLEDYVTVERIFG